MRRAAWVSASLLWLCLAGPGVVAAQQPQDSAQEVADTEEAHGPVGFGDVWAPIEFWGAVVNFALLLGIFFRYGRKPLGDYLSGRRRQVEEGLAEAQQMKAAAEAKYQQYSSRLERLDTEIEKIRAEMVKAGEVERDRIVANAETKAARMRREAAFRIEQQMKQLAVDLKGEAVRAAVAAAREVLAERTSAGDQGRLAQSYLQSIETRAREASAAKAGGHP